MSNPTYFTVVGDFRSIVQDLDSDSDYNPNIVPISATVTFTPVINSGDIILATEATPNPIGFIPAPVTAIIDGDDGQLKLRALPDEGNTSGLDFVPVRLLADSPLLELSGPLYYTVYFTNVTFAGKTGKITGFGFQAPNSDTTLDLITVARTPGSPAGGINRIAPTGVRFDGDTMVFSFAGVDIPDPLPLSEITGPQGLGGTVTVGNVTTLSHNQSVTVTNSGTPENAVLNFGIPEGEPATVEIGTVTNIDPGVSPTVTNSGTARNAVLDFELPVSATIEVGTVTPLNSGDTPTVSNSGTAQGAVLDFGIPQSTTVSVGTVTTVAPEQPATVTDSGTVNAAVLDFEIPQGIAATVTVGGVTTVAPEQPATVTNNNTSADAVLDFEIPQGAAATIEIGTVNTVAPNLPAAVTNVGTTADAVLDFDIPKGDTGLAATVDVGTITTLNPGSSATVTNSGTSGAAVLNFGLPQGFTGATGPQGEVGPKGDAATITIGTITTVSPGSPASVTNVGTAGDAIFDFSIPKGDTGSADSTVWGDIPNQPAVIAAGATKSDARTAIDAEYTGNKGVANGYAGLDSAGKVPYSQLPSSIMSYLGVWNASTNSPTLADGTGDPGDVYRVGTAGAQNLGSGSITFEVGDYAIYNGSTWERSDSTDAVSSVAGKTGTVTLTKSDVGLANVDNTSDANKPISTATQTALDGKEPTITAGTSGQYWRGDKTFATLNKNAVGLGNVDNTADLNKPISNATQTALDAKEATANKGAANGYAALDSSGKVPTEQLPITQAEWSTLSGKPTYVAAGATKADARAAIDAEYSGDKGQPGGYASLDSSGYIPLSQWGAQVLNGGSAASSTTDIIDGGTA